MKKLSVTFSFKEQLNTRTRPEEIISGVPDLTSSTQDSSTAINRLKSSETTRLNRFSFSRDGKEKTVL